MKTLIIDIETAPNIAHVWGLWKQNVGLTQLLASGYTLCFSAKWLGEEEVIFKSLHHDGEEDMLKTAHTLLDEADAIIHYNGEKFDIPTLNKEFVLKGMHPPAPSKQIDLLRVVKRRFRFPSNKLDYVASVLGLGKKTKHIGHALWIGCMNGDAVSWNSMKEYNIQDVALTEDLYNKLLGWIPHHPSIANHNNEVCCTRCGSHSLQKRGFYQTHVSTFQRYRCNDCGGWMRGRVNTQKNHEIPVPLVG